MPGTVSISDLTASCARATANGLSAEAKTLEAIEFRSAGETSITFGQHLVEGFVRLIEACDVANKDPEVEPITPEAYRTAEAFLKCLPATIPLPDVMVHPDGDVAFEWHRGKRNVLTVSIGSAGSLAFAGLFGVGTIYGREAFAGSLPDTIAHCLARLFPVQVVSSPTG